MAGTENFDPQKNEKEYNQIIVGASSVAIDEDMSDAIYDPNSGIFLYK